MSSYLKRLQKELQRITQDPPANCSAYAVNNDITNWEAVILGPKDTPYEGGIFKLQIVFKNQFPFKPPEIKFKTKIFHPNISERGDICLDILKDQWSPALQMDKVLLSICSLLASPNPDDPLVANAANLYKTNRGEYNRVVEEWVRLYAQESSKDD